MSATAIRALTAADRGWLRALITRRWGAEIVVVHGAVYRPHALDGFVAEQDGAPAGVLTYHVAGDACEIVTLDSLREGMGIGTALIAAAREVAQQSGCGRLWLITTNDNTHALRFYQRRGFVLAALRRDAVSTARRIKPEIPLIGDDGIPIRDEIELELLLG